MWTSTLSGNRLCARVRPPDILDTDVQIVREPAARQHRHRTTHSPPPPPLSTRNKHFKSYLDETTVLDGQTKLKAKDMISSHMVRGCMCVPKLKPQSRACAPLGSTRRMLASAPNPPAARTPHCFHSRNISSPL